MSALRLNIGSGGFNLDGWVNIDALPHVGADMVCAVPPLPYPDDAAEEIYAGHVLEHMPPDVADMFLAECRRVLAPGGRLGVVVPDTREIMRRYVLREPAVVEWPYGTLRDLRDLDQVCAMVLYSTEQESPHVWSYDLATLRRALTVAGLTVTGEIDRHRDPRIPVGAWYQCGLDAVNV